MLSKTCNTSSKMSKNLSYYPEIPGINTQNPYQRNNYGEYQQRQPQQQQKEIIVAPGFNGYIVKKLHQDMQHF